MPLSQAAKVAYWKEREVRWAAYVQKLGRVPTTSDHVAFSKAEKPFIKAAKDGGGAKKPRTVKTAPVSCKPGEEPKMVYGKMRCVVATGMGESKDLPEDPWRYFEKESGATLVPLSKLVLSHDRGQTRAESFMRAAYNGTGDKRAPISVRERADGTFTVLDGNSTCKIARAAGWKTIPVIVKEQAMSDIRNRMTKLVAEGSDHSEWEKLSDQLEPVIATVKKMMQKLRAGAGEAAKTDLQMLQALLAASVNVKKWADGD